VYFYILTPPLNVRGAGWGYYKGIIIKRYPLSVLMNQKQKFLAVFIFWVYGI